MYRSSCAIVAVNLVRTRFGVRGSPPPPTRQNRGTAMSYARNVSFTIKNGQIDEFKRLMNTEVLPLLKKENGFRQDLTILGSKTGMSTSVWDDRACAETYNTKTYPQV